MSGKRLLSAFLSLAFVTPVTLPCRAQEGAVAEQANRQPQNLQEIVDEIVWKPEQQGLLLIVSPATVSRQMRWTMQANGTMAPPPPASIPPKSAQGLRLSVLEQYFPSVVVPCGDVTVLAPAKMMVLNFENLPQPSAYAGFKPDDSFQLLQGSFTKAQWQQATSPNGIGLADLNAEQRELFLAAFPQKMTVTQNKNGEYTSTPLEENQRRGIRFRVVRSMNWGFSTGQSGTISVGREEPARTSLTVEQNVDWEKQQRQVYGTEIASEVTARFKPSQLAYDWEGLDAQIDLTDVKTVGDLVTRLRETTRVELYCDPRYARLPIYLRGGQARAGNLAKALARGVTGTWRRLDNAYVLTDDLVGLGVRHARIMDWINQNNALGAEVDGKLIAALRETKPAQYAGYAEDDAFMPSEKLRAKYQEFQTALRAPRKPGDSPPDYNKMWPVSELPAAAQEEIRRQADQFAKGQYGDNNKNINAEAVQLYFNTAMKVSIPGVGWADAPFNTNLMQYSDEQNFPGPQTAPVKPEPKPLPVDLKVRALIIDLKPDEKLGQVYQEARRAGFTEVWGDIDAIPTESVQAAVQAAHASKLKFRALVPALRQKTSKAKNENIDVNILGETYTQYLARTLQSGMLPVPYYVSEADRKRMAMAMKANMERQRERGDWHDPSAPDTATLVGQRIENLLKTVVVDGIVLRDVTPPGYGAADPRFGFNENGTIEGGGYSVSRRLALLRETGVDPVDLSPVGDSGFNRYSGQRLRQRNYLQIQLPLFPDYGVNAVNTTINGVNATKLGAGSAAQEWNKLRQDDLESALVKIQARARKIAADVPVWFYQRAPETTGYSYAPSYVESRDKAAEVSGTSKSAGATTPNIAQLQTAARTNPYAIPPGMRAGSSTVLFSLDISAQTAAPGAPSKADLLAGMASYLFNPKTPLLKDYDGIVLDFGRETPEELLAEVGMMPAPKEAPVPLQEEAPTPTTVPKKTAQPKPRLKRP